MNRRILLLGLVLAGLELEAVSARADGGSGSSGSGGSNSGSGSSNSGSGSSGSGGGDDDENEGGDDNGSGSGSVDWNEAADAVERGDIEPLQVILKIALANTPGKVIGVRLKRKGTNFTYRIKIFAATGRKVELAINARTRKIIKV